MANNDNELDDQSALSEEQYLTFHLGHEVYGIEVLRIKEIIQYQGVTKVPRTPEYILGVINLRGSVVPVVDMLNLFGEEHVQISRRTCIIIVEAHTGEEAVEAGVIVDQVDEVAEIRDDEIEKAPSFGAGVKTQFIKGMGRREDGFIILLHLDKILAPEELHSFKEQSGALPGPGNA